ncbi:MAG TPA: adenosine kinase [Candidatus Cryptobacteroides merdipullorum]|uniref:Adenosine kinase n=1 Tax=Candidatus Cryptobacteroides merdipullorum TaxID=2840771 RepID=A0A9D1GMQ0_9BACT|nr:adenosine kinase [Candidatus Cryptobacteroides merdipullorum]
MKSILGIGNALTDILAVLPDDSLLNTFHLPKGSMQHVDMETGDGIWAALKPLGVKYVAGGSAANTITCTAILGMPSGFIGKIGDDELGELFKSDQEQYGVKTTLLKSPHSSGRSMVFVSGGNAERTFAVYLGAALDLVPEDLKPEWFEGYDYFHIEGYLVQNQGLVRRAVEYARRAGCIISIDMASYNVVESNQAFLHDIVEKYVDIVFANETESKSFTKLDDPRAALDEIAKMCDIAVVKVGKDGSMIKSGDEYHFIEAWPADTIDATGAGDTYAAGFLYAHSLGLPLEICGDAGSIIAAKVVEVIGTKIDIPRWKVAKRELRELIASAEKK